MKILKVLNFLLMLIVVALLLHIDSNLAQFANSVAGFHH